MKYYRYGVMVILLGIMTLLAACGASPALAGDTWQLIEYGNPNDLTAATVERDSTIVFDSESGSFSGNTGCNSFEGNYEANVSEFTVTGPITHTEMACPGLPAEQEQSLLKILQAAESYNVEEDTLTITSPDGVLIYKRQANE